MTVLTGKAQWSESFRLVKPSITRLATCPGSGALSQLSTGANSQASGLSVPPARRLFRYWTVSRQTVPTAPASRPAAMAARGVSGCFLVRMASLQSGQNASRPAASGGLGAGSQGRRELRRVVGDQVAPPRADARRRVRSSLLPAGRRPHVL